MRAEFLGIPIDVLTFEETVSAAIDAMLTRKTTHHVAMNVAKLVKARHDPELYRDVSESNIVGIDGMGIVWGARALGISVPHRVPGVELMERLLAICAAHDFRPYFLGARRSVLDRAVVNSLHRWPGLTFAGYRDGYFTPENEAQVVEDIRFCAPDCLFIGMPTPRKERFLHQYRDVLGVPFIMGVGGGIDVLAGHVRRAPQGVQRAGLEWLYRTWQEPRRMWWRYASTNAVFAGLLGKAMIARAMGRGGVSGHVRGGHA